MRPGDPDGTAVVLRLGVALDRYWWARSRLPEAFGLLVPALRRPDARADPALFGAALVTAAMVAYSIDVATARQLGEQAVRLAQQIGWENAIVPANLGDVLRAEGDPAGARSTVEAALRISRRNGDTLDMAYAILSLACLAGDAGDWDRAAALHGAAQAFLDRTGNPWQKWDARNRRDSLERARSWAMSSWNGPTPRAWRSASTRPSTWPCEDRTRADRCRRLTPGRS